MLQTDDRQMTDGWPMTYSERELEFTLSSHSLKITSNHLDCIASA